MTLQKTIEEVCKLIEQIDANNTELEAWMRFTDAIDFLSTFSNRVIPISIYATKVTYEKPNKKNLKALNSIYVESFFVSKRKIKSANPDDFINWQLDYDIKNSVDISYSDNTLPKLTAQVHGTNTKLLEGSTAIKFERYLIGLNGEKIPEINQQVIQPLDIYLNVTENAYLKSDHLGDQQKVIEFTKSDENDVSQMNLVVMMRDEIELYMYYSQTELVRIFNLIRGIPDGFSGERSDLNINRNSLRANISFGPTPWNLKQIYMKGGQVFRNSKSKKEMYLISTNSSPRKYESFRALIGPDLKTTLLDAKPSDTQSYITSIGIPIDYSPVFFRAEIFEPFRNNPSKYKITRWEVRGKTWGFKYKFNEENQVFVYIKDMIYLPYEIQLLMKAYNVEPLAGIPSQVMLNDWEGSWEFAYDPIQSLTEILQQFPIHSTSVSSIWKLPDNPPEKNLDAFNGILVGTNNEWDSQCRILRMNTIEGFDENVLKSFAKELGNKKNEMRSIGLLKFIFDNSNRSELNELIIQPLKEINEYRKEGSHSGDIKKKPNDLRREFYELTQKCDIAFRKLAELVEENFFVKSKSTK